jgi:hypothetical protein
MGNPDIADLIAQHGLPAILAILANARAELIAYASRHPGTRMEQLIHHARSVLAAIVILGNACALVSLWGERFCVVYVRPASGKGLPFDGLRYFAGFTGGGQLWFLHG